MTKRFFTVVIYVLFLILLLEAWARGYYALKRNVSFWVSPKELALMWYPELKRLSEHDERAYNVLLLGGSALMEEWGEVPKFLKKELLDFTRKKVAIVNLSVPAHGTLDSFYKYGSIGDKKFDLVIVYHGINETRANNAPPDVWRDDYSHYSWYREVNFYFNHPLLLKMPFILPYFLEHLLVQLDREVLNRNGYVPPHTPKKEWLGYGAQIKTKKMFRKNLEKIVDVASKRKENILIMTYGFYESRPGDSPWFASFELWGEREFVIKGMREHNSAVRELASDGGFWFVDQEKLLGGKKEYFTDICHLSEEGSRLFSRNIVEMLKKRLNTATHE